MWSLQPEPKRIVRLLDDSGHELGRMVNPRSFSSTTELIMPAGVYAVKPVKWYHSRVELRFNDVPMMEVRYGWSHITAYRTGTEQMLFRLERTSFWGQAHTMTDATGRLLATIRSKISWTRMDRDHTLTELGDPRPEPLQVLLALTAMNIRYRRQVAASA